MTLSEANGLKYLGTFDQKQVRYRFDEDLQEILLTIDSYGYPLSFWWIYKEATVDAVGLSEWWEANHQELLNSIRETEIISGSDLDKMNQMVEAVGLGKHRFLLDTFPMFPRIVRDREVENNGTNGTKTGLM